MSDPSPALSLRDEARPETDGAVLIGRAKNGDAEAFGELYLQYMDAIFRYVRFRVATAADAEDLTEQVFLKAWEGLPNYQQRGVPFSSWLYRIAHNVVVDHHRRRPSVTSLDEHENLGSDEQSALDHFLRASELDELALAISQLAEEQQQVIVLRFIEGLSHAQVARIIDKTEGACRVIQHRALSALHRLLAGS